MADFSLTKWYLDVVGPDGSVGIAYWARVAWARLRYSFCGVLVHPAGSRASRWRFHGSAQPPPAPDGRGLRWEAAPLGLSVELARREPAFGHRLLDTAEGIVDWRCEVPRADVRLRSGAHVLEGAGYAERLQLTFPPWRLPVDEIRWGRWLAPDRSLVWIDWRGARELSLAFRDGHRTAVASISDRAIQCEDGLRLTLDGTSTVSADTLGGLLSPLRPLAPLVGRIARTRQTRWLSWGEMQEPAGRSVRGWALHELVGRP